MHAAIGSVLYAPRAAPGGATPLLPGVATNNSPMRPAAATGGRYVARHAVFALRRTATLATAWVIDRSSARSTARRITTGPGSSVPSSSACAAWRATTSTSPSRVISPLCRPAVNNGSIATPWVSKPSRSASTKVPAQASAWRLASPAALSTRAAKRVRSGAASRMAMGSWRCWTGARGSASASREYAYFRRVGKALRIGTHS